jgi:hypothetical protein
LRFDTKQGQEGKERNEHRTKPCVGRMLLPLSPPQQQSDSRLAAARLKIR